jgi:CheY-like chemotaxis protein
MQKYNCVLLVDDDLVSSFLIKEILIRFKVTEHTHTARNGQEALHFIKENFKTETACPDLVFLDINMPVMDGFEFLEEFQKLSKQQKETLKIIVLTSSANPADVTKAKQYFIEGYITKPLTFEKLQNILS